MAHRGWWLVVAGLLSMGWWLALRAPCHAETVGRLVNTGMVIGPPAAPEVNINKLKRGPRGWVFGSTEENGYMFIIDPATMQWVQWNAGRQQPRAGQSVEGDITDFIVWEAAGRLIILACQAYPAEIYRYEVALPSTGLPDMTTARVRRVYENARWGRVMALAVGRGPNGKTMLLAGSQHAGELIRSSDRGFTWFSVPYIGATGDLDTQRHQDQLHWRATMFEIHFRQGTWFVYTRNAFLLASETPWTSGYRHNINAILLSRDGGVTWRVAHAAPNPRLPAALRTIINADRAQQRLHPHLYGLVGECATNLVQLRNGLLLLGVNMNSVPEPPFGGRLLASTDHGSTWSERSFFPGVTAVSLASLGTQTVLAGTMTKLSYPPARVATGDLYLSHDSGRSFRFVARVVATAKPSVFRRNIYVAGVSAMVHTRFGTIVGTVNEGGQAELFLLSW